MPRTLFDNQLRRHFKPGMRIAWRRGGQEIDGHVTGVWPNGLTARRDGVEVGRVHQVGFAEARITQAPAEESAMTRNKRKDRRKPNQKPWGQWKNEQPLTFVHPASPKGVFDCQVNKRYIVMFFMHRTAMGLVLQLMVRRRDEAVGVPWSDLQRIKNELCGPEACAVEVFPAESRLVDQCNIYHLWVLPPGFVLPFDLKDASATLIVDKDEAQQARESLEPAGV